jgi:MoxR-like ATPase
MLPSDVTGTMALRAGELVFRPGPVFAGVVLADEINRTPPKTQAALLEAMQEKQVSVEGVTYRLDPPFHVLATANPIEYEGTYPLPEAQLDRFLLRVSFGYPSPEEEWEVLRRRMGRRQEESEVPVVVDAATLLAMQAAMEDVVVENSVGGYIVALTAATRAHPNVLVGASPRGSLALLLLARAWAALSGRTYVVPEDVKTVAVPALAHRITLRPELWLRRVEPATVVADVLERTPVPASGALPRHS